MAVDTLMHILVVDDYDSMRRIARNLLKQLGFEHVDETTHGGDALIKLRMKPYGLVIAGQEMEPINGLELLRQVRADAKLKTMPFLIVTTESKPENVLTAENDGHCNYIVKPFNAETLRIKMASVLGEF